KRLSAVGYDTNVGIGSDGPSLERLQDRVLPNTWRRYGVELRNQSICLTSDRRAIGCKTQRQIGIVRQQQSVAVEHRSGLEAFELQVCARTMRRSLVSLLSGVFTDRKYHP